MISKKVRNAVLSSIMAASMLLGVLCPLSPLSSDGEVKTAVIGDEGADGLTKVDVLNLSSPDEKIKVQLWEDADGAYYYSAYLNDYVVLQCSLVGIVTKDADLSKGLVLDAGSVKVTDGKDEYDIIQGPVNHVNKEYKELEFKLTKDNADVVMQFRVSNDGMAYRYLVDADRTQDNESVSITSEASSFVLPDGGTIWTNSPSATYEGGRYEKRAMAQVKSSNASYSAPILAEIPAANGAWALLSEASVYNNDNPYCASIFQTKGGSKALQIKFGPRLIGEDDMSKHGFVGDRPHEDVRSVEFTGSFETPWRAAIIGEDLNAVTSSTLITDLNPPAEGDFSWVVPGTSVWSWWSTASDNIDYGSMLDYIDFCSNSGIEYCLVDFGWEVWDNYEEKIKGLVEYADERDVGLILWYGVHKWDAKHIFDLDNIDDIEEQFAWCERMGVKGVKVDYIESDSQFAMRNMYWIIDIAAKHHLVVNFHGCTDPNGENRTYPNILSSEAVCGMEYFKWSDASPVETLMILPLTRNVIGSMEYTPALQTHPRSIATSGFMLSMCIQYESAVQTFAQSGYVYPGYTGFSLISDVPSTWDESILVEAYPGEYITRARRNGENWYIGSMTKEAGVCDVYLDFLDPDCTYNAYIYKDNSDGTDIELETTTVSKDDYITVPLLENGGCAIKLTKNDPVKWTVYDNYNYYEAENAQLSGRTAIKDGVAAAAGRAFVNGLGSSKDNSITFDNINVPEDGTYQFKVYLISSSKSNLKVDINNGENVISLSNLVGIEGDWGDSVGDSGEYIDIDLHAGDNTITLYNDSGNSPSIDRIAVSKALISDAEVTLSQNEYEYTGNECRPSVTVVRDGKTLTEGEQYELFYSNNINAGTATVYVTGINGFGGRLSKEYTIKAKEVPVTPPVSNTNNPPAVTNLPHNTPDAPTAASVKAPARVKIKSLKSTAKGKVVVKYKKLKGVSGYQVSYSTNKKFKKAKTLTVKSNKAKAVIKKLKSGKRYYVKVRAYNLDGTKKVTGKWSKVKVVKKVK